MQPIAAELGETNRNWRPLRGTYTKYPKCLKSSFAPALLTLSLDPCNQVQARQGSSQAGWQAGQQPGTGRDEHVAFWKPNKTGVRASRGEVVYC